MLEKLHLSGDDLPHQMDKSGWPLMKARFETLFKTQTRDQWCELMEGTDICFAPVLSMDEAPEHPHLKSRRTFVDPGGVVQPAPSPRFSRTSPSLERLPAHAGQHTDEVLADFGFGAEEIARLREAKIVA